MRRVQQGQPVKAEHFNDLARFVERIGGQSGTTARPVTRVWGINKTGADLDLYAVAASGTSPYEDAILDNANKQFALRAHTPDALRHRVPLVALEQIKDGEGGWFAVGGVCLARVQDFAVEDWPAVRESDLDLRASGDGTRLIPTPAGRVEILQFDASSNLALVRLPSRAVDVILCKAQAAITAESLFVMDGTGTDTIGSGSDSVTVEHIKAALTLTGYSDTLHPASVLAVSPGYDLAEDDYFLAREYWPRWVRTSAEATVNGCVGHDESSGGAADPWLPGYRVIAIDGTTRALVTPDHWGTAGTPQDGTTAAVIYKMLSPASDKDGLEIWVNHNLEWTGTAGDSINLTGCKATFSSSGVLLSVGARETISTLTTEVC